MAQFIIDCAGLARRNTEAALLAAVRDAACASGLFPPAEVKVRLRHFEHHSVGTGDEPMVHVAAYMYPGRTAAAKAALSAAVVRALCTCLPDVAVISMDIREMARESYCSRSILESAT